MRKVITIDWLSFLLMTIDFDPYPTEPPETVYEYIHNMYAYSGIQFAIQYY